jgi:serine/threonine-protein kinase HipA
MEILNVYLHDTLVGELRREGTELSFRYVESYLALPALLPLSRHLPFSRQTPDHVFGDLATRAFFENLLPEGGVRDRVARSLGLSRGNVFGLLEAIGGDCAGGISVVPPEKSLRPQSSYRPVSPDQLAAELASLPAHPLLAGEENVRLSLAGAQNKLPVYFDGTDFFIPQGNAPSSHILKTAIPHLENAVVNEAFCMNLAARVGLRVPVARVVRVGDEQVYLVERYDREKTVAGGIVRLHQEDFCQALGVPPDLKYEKEGGPGFSQCFELVRDWSSEPLADVASLLHWSLFNFLIGNADAHGKNISFLYTAGVVRLAPFYDLISTAVYERQVDNKFAMKMGGQKDPRYLAAQNLEKFAGEIGIGSRAVRAGLSELVERVEAEAALLAEEYRQTFGSSVIIGRLVRVLAQRIAKAKTMAG